ncbi:stage II sporulation protein D [Agathobaculum sp.]|uniref:stage II sporulation protein D n=1 Tax=Agathobaculum sp. TaxID=2048138 RepID=UPI002A81614A|nr:stage II sporulation protein D [Agathobaculum sp.]MCI5704027.1 stage II sporulation protein D [Pseudoflavonifractor sp.]MDY3618913.1 stage II sporulation protein D [Agathobaculum sp.]
MRKLLFVGLGLVAVLYLLPAAVRMTGAGDSLAIDFEQLDLPGAVPVNQESGGQAPAGTQQTDTPVSEAHDHTTVTALIDGKETELPLESYVEGVVAAEISNDFPLDAIRAQAVAARTYAVYKIDRGRPEAHPGADVCDDYHHCAAYRDVAVETAAGSDLSRVQQAVKDTAGQILTYDGAPIAAVFHCASGPRTESAADVWGGDDTPYLKSVVSPGGTACDQYESAVTVKADDFRKAVAEVFPSADVSGAPKTWFKASVRSDAGGIKTVKLGGVTVEGTAVRTLFGLNSTNFTITYTKDSITFHSIGFGHGVGLSQYGARYMAEQGADYKEILMHYYPGSEFSDV